MSSLCLESTTYLTGLYEGIEGLFELVIDIYLPLTVGIYLLGVKLLSVVLFTLD